MRKHTMLVGAAALGLTWLTGSAQARAQQPVAPPPPPPAPAAGTSDLGSAAAAREEAALAEAMSASPGGLTADEVGKRAATTSYQAKAYAEALRGAGARVDAAFAGFLPRLTLTGRYTRLSDFTPPTLNIGGGGQLVGTIEPPGTINPTPTQAVAITGFSFPIVVNDWLLQASLVVPISDYFLRINQGYSAATHARDAARYDVEAQRAASAADGKVAYYNWIRARGAVVVANLALNDQKTHLTDTKNLFQVGNASQVDVLRGQTAVSSAELSVVQAQQLVELTEQQLRIAMHTAPDATFAVGETVDATEPPSVQGSLTSLIAEAKTARLEVKSIDANADAARAQARAIKNGAYPSLSAFGDVIEANPNQRVFPQRDQWFPTWDAGAQITWTPNDVWTSVANGADADSRVAQLEAQREAMRDGIALEVTQAYQRVLLADRTIQSTLQQLASAREAVRVARELFRAGRVTSTTLTDAETELTRARLGSLNARVDARIARVKLEHSLGRDTRLIAPSP